MTAPFRQLPGAHGSDVVLVADHASNHVPPAFELGIDGAHLQAHIALDIGIEPLANALSKRLRAPAHLSAVSRLVADMNRPAETTIPQESDGVRVPGNSGLEGPALARRLALHHDYHSALGGLIRERGPALLVSLHSFTPRMTGGEPRPWDCGVLYDQDSRAAMLAKDILETEGLCVGDNEPYSGASHGYTMQRHGEARGIPYLFFEIRQDQLSTEGGLRLWADRLARLVPLIRDRL